VQCIDLTALLSRYWGSQPIIFTIVKLLNIPTMAIAIISSTSVNPEFFIAVLPVRNVLVKCTFNPVVINNLYSGKVTAAAQKIVTFEVLFLLSAINMPVPALLSITLF
jgi:hypothetical protein